MEDTVITTDMIEGNVGMPVMADAVDMERELIATGGSVELGNKPAADSNILGPETAMADVTEDTVGMGSVLVVIGAIKDCGEELLAANVMRDSARMERELAVTGTTEDTDEGLVVENRVVITSGARSDTVIEPTSSAVSTEMPWLKVEVTVESVGNTAERTA